MCIALDPLVTRTEPNVLHLYYSRIAAVYSIYRLIYMLELIIMRINLGILLSCRLVAPRGRNIYLNMSENTNTITPVNTHKFAPFVFRAPTRSKTVEQNVLSFKGCSKLRNSVRGLGSQ